MLRIYTVLGDRETDLLGSFSPASIELKTDIPVSGKEVRRKDLEHEDARITDIIIEI